MVEAGFDAVTSGDGDEGEEVVVVGVVVVSEVAVVSEVGNGMVDEESGEAMVEGNVNKEGGENLNEASAATDGRVCFKIILFLFVLSPICELHPLVARTRGVEGGRVVQAWFTDHPWLFPCHHH